MALRVTKLTVVPATRTVILCMLISLTLSGLPSCAVTDFVSAYFNTYYNAQTLFNQAETEVFTQLDSRPGGRNWLGAFTIQGGTRTKLESVIEKCSKLLQYHPDSKLVDDALLMIGKAYYYEDDNQQAERKFNEIISGYPNGSCAIEARLLLSYAQYRMNAREDSKATALQVIDIAKKENERAMISRASLVLGQMAQEDKDFAGAREYFDQAAEFGGTPEERSSASLMSAEMYRKMGMYREAEKAYRRAINSSDNYAGEYRGRIGEIRMMTKQGEYNDALRGLRFLRADAKNKEFFGEIELEIAETYRAMGDLPLAVEHYTLVDTVYPRSEYSARSFFALGDLYEHTLFLYDSALVAYTKGRNEYPMAEVTKLCVRRAEYLTRYFQFHTEIARCDTLLALALVARDTSKRPQNAMHDTSGGQLSTVRGADTVRQQIPPRPAMPPAITADSARARREKAVDELAGLFFATIGIPDSAEFWYMRIVTDYPSGRYVPRALYTLAQIYAGRDSVASKPVVDSLYREIIRRFPRSDFAPEARRLLGLPPENPTVDEAESAYGRAEHLMVTGDSTGAAEGFKNLARQYPSSPLASRALYAAGWIYENRLYNRDSAISSYTQLLALYPGSPYSARVAPKIAEVNLQQKQLAAAADSAARRLNQSTAAAADSAARRLNQNTAPAAADSLHRGNNVIPPKPSTVPNDSTELRKIRPPNPRTAPGKEGTIPR